MPGIHTRGARITRGAIAAASAFVLVGGCATQPAVIVESSRDVRVVEVSDEVAEMIAERVAAYIPTPPAYPQARGNPAGYRPAAPVVDRPVRVRVDPVRAARGPYVAPDRKEVFLPAPDVAATELSKGTMQAVDKALAWLAQHQAPDGAWYASGFSEQCGGKCDGAGEPAYTPGLTGLALLCFVRDGHTMRDGEYKDVVKNGLKYLRQIQDSEGCFGPRVSQHFMYNHAAASLAVIEAYGATESPILSESAQSAVNFIQYAQNPYLGWRYGVRDGDNDTSMTCWMTQALASAQRAGLTVDAGGFSGAKSWVDKMTEPEFGRVGYNRRGGPTARTTEAMNRFPADLSEAMTAAGLVTRLSAGQSAQASEAIQKGADLLAARPPTWNVDKGTNDFYYWHLGTAAMRHVGGPRWNAWQNSLYAAAVGNQHGSGAHVEGSWDPVDAWSNDGGRVYATTTLCLALLEMQESLIK